MEHIIDARGLSCPQPVILAKKAMEENDEVVILVDDKTASENVKRLAANMGFSVDEERKGAETHIRINKGSACSLAAEAISRHGPVVVVLSSDTMGRGEEVLGGVLMKSFLHTLAQTTPIPDVMILFNTGVRLAAKGSEVLEDLDALMNAGVKIMACGTCLNYLSLKDKLAAGEVSNMYDIAQTMLTAGRIVQV